ncbi:MAG: class I mannose-6-phosphate isomerase [Lachnospiraceae bacterium]|nr:class I mannose-6-phosphate isomerase [Lachnospiraceae bacterium]
MKENKELIFLKPVLKERIWGGSRLRTEWGYESDRQGTFGECWAVSSNEQADCEIAGGAYQGRHLSELWKECPELFGGKTDGAFPLLVKIIDAGEDLSVQVHPDDAYAQTHGCKSGKWECWYILDCPEEAELIVGSHARSREELEQWIKDGAWDKLLNRVPIRKGDFLRVDPGTLHAITAGVELLEVQQNSDITYRIYDYERRQNGKLRELHLEDGLEVTRVPYRITAADVIHTDVRENTMQLLAETAQYRMWTIAVKGVAVPEIRTERFLVGSVLEGSGTIDGVQVRKGMHFIIPHGYAPEKLEGQMRLNLTEPAG